MKLRWQEPIPSSYLCMISHLKPKAEQTETGTYSTLELWTIQTLANSAPVNSDPKKFGPSQFGPRPLVNSDPDHWSIRTLFLLVNSDLKKKNSLVNSDLISWSIRTLSIGEFGPFPLVNSDLFHWSIRTFSFGQFGPFPLISSGL